MASGRRHVAGRRARHHPVPGKAEIRAAGGGCARSAITCWPRLLLLRHPHRESGRGALHRARHLSTRRAHRRSRRAGASLVPTMSPTSHARAMARTRASANHQIQKINLAPEEPGGSDPATTRAVCNIASGSDLCWATCSPIARMELDLNGQVMNRWRCFSRPPWSTPDFQDCPIASARSSAAFTADLLVVGRQPLKNPPRVPEPCLSLHAIVKGGVVFKRAI